MKEKHTTNSTHLHPNKCIAHHSMRHLNWQSLSQDYIHAHYRHSKSRLDRYRIILNRFDTFLRNRVINIQDIDATLIQDYEKYLLNAGLKRNTSSYYIRGLRSIYNAVIKEYLSRDSDVRLPPSPFRGAYTGVDKTSKRALTRQEIVKLSIIKLDEERLYFARDIFIFSFLTRGMSLIDIANLRTDSVRNGVLTYARSKTKRVLTIEWEWEMQHIVDRYHQRGSKYLFPIFNEGEGSLDSQYSNFIHRINRDLKRIGEQLGLMQPLTTYVARHSWASLAYEESSIDVISDAMGHSSPEITRIYLKSLSSSAVNILNRKIIDIINTPLVGRPSIQEAL